MATVNLQHLAIHAIQAGYDVTVEAASAPDESAYLDITLKDDDETIMTVYEDGKVAFFGPESWVVDVCDRHLVRSILEMIDLQLGTSLGLRTTSS